MQQVPAGGRKEEAVASDSTAQSKCGVPAEDNLQLGAVQFPTVRQSHDAFLVALQSLLSFILPRRRKHSVTCQVDVSSQIKRLSALLPICSCHKDLAAKLPIPARQCSRSHPE